MALRSFRERLSKRLVLTVFGLLVLSLLYWGLGSTRWTTHAAKPSSGQHWVSPQSLHQLTHRLLQEQRSLDPKLAQQQAQRMLEARLQLAHNLHALGMATSDDVVAASLKHWQTASGLDWNTWHARMNAGLQRQGITWASWLNDWVRELEWSTFANVWSEDLPTAWPTATPALSYQLHVEWFDHTQQELLRHADSSPDALRRYYQQHRHDYTTPARVRFNVVRLHASEPFDVNERQRLEAASYDNANDLDALAQAVGGDLVRSPWFSLKQHQPLSARSSSLSHLALERMRTYLAQHPEGMSGISDPLYVDAQTVLWFQQREVRKPEPRPFAQVQASLKQHVAAANLKAQTQATLAKLNSAAPTTPPHPTSHHARWSQRPKHPTWAASAWRAFFTQPPQSLPTPWLAVSNPQRSSVIFYRVLTAKASSTQALPAARGWIAQLYRRRLVAHVLTFKQ